MDLNAARTTTVNLVSDLLSNLLLSKQGGSYTSGGVLVVQPDESFSVGIPDVDESIVPALHEVPEYLLADGVVVDARVD